MCSLHFRLSPVFHWFHPQKPGHRRRCERMALGAHTGGHLIRDANCVWVRVLTLMFMTSMRVWIMGSLCEHIFHHMQRAVFPKCCHNVLCITNNTVAINEHLPTRTELHTILLSPPSGSVCQSRSRYALTWVELLVIIISHWTNKFSSINFWSIGKTKRKELWCSVRSKTIDG